jgi:hypothetical protein
VDLHTGGTYRETAVDLHVASVRNIMRQLGMAHDESKLRETYTAVTGTFARSAVGGFFLAHAEPRETCKEGDLIALVVEISHGDHFKRVLGESMTWTLEGTPIASCHLRAARCPGMDANGLSFRIPLYRLKQAPLCNSRSNRAPDRAIPSARRPRRSSADHRRERRCQADQ